MNKNFLKSGAPTFLNIQVFGCCSVENYTTEADSWIARQESLWDTAFDAHSLTNDNSYEFNSDALLIPLAHILCRVRLIFYQR